MNLASYNKVSLEMETLNKQMLALESYEKVLTGTKSSGPFLQEILAVSLESVDPGASYFDIKEGSGLTLKSLGTKIKDVAKKIWGLILKILDIGRSFYVKLSGSIARVRKAQVINNERLSKLGSNSKQVKINLTNVERLSIDSKFKGFDLEALTSIENATKFFVREYPKAVIDFVRNSNRNILNVLSGDISDDKTLEQKKLIESLIKPYNETFNKLPRKENYTWEGLECYRTDFLPGNRCFIYSKIDSILNSKGDSLDLSNLIKIDFISASLNVPDDRPKDYDVPKVTALKELNNKLGDILTVAEDAHKVTKDFDKLKTVLEDAIDEISSKETEDKHNLRSIAIMNLGNMMKHMGKPDIKYIDWVAVTVHVYILLIRKCIESYNTQEK